TTSFLNCFRGTDGSSAGGSIKIRLRPNCWWFTVDCRGRPSAVWSAPSLQRVRLLQRGVNWPEYGSWRLRFCNTPTLTVHNVHHGSEQLEGNCAPFPVWPLNGP